MSRAARDWAWAALPFCGGKTRVATRKLLLLYLAERANHAGECFPGVDTIAAATLLDPRSVLYGLADLQEEGLLTVERRTNAKGHRTSNRYRLALAGRLPKPGVAATEPWPIEAEPLSANVAPRNGPALSATAAGLSVSSAALSANTPPEPERENQKVNQRESARARVAAGAAPSLSEFLEMDEIQKAGKDRGMSPAILRDCLQKFLDHHDTRRHRPDTWVRLAVRWIKAEQFDPPRQTPAERPWKRHDHREAVRIHDEAMAAAFAAEAQEIQAERVDPEPVRTPEQKQAARSGLQAVRNLIAGVALAKPEDEPE